MRKSGLMLVGLCFFSSLVFAQNNVTASKPVAVISASAVKPVGEAPAPVKEEVVTLKGDIIDNAFVNAHKADSLADVIKTYTKAGALMSPSVLSGYSIYAGGKLSKFDKVSDAQIEEFLKKKENKLRVEVTAKKTGESLSLISIQNQK